MGNREGISDAGLDVAGAEPAGGKQPGLSTGWYVLHVHAGREKWIANTLRTAGKGVCLPLQHSLRRWSDRSKRIELPVFPGYVFCEFDSNVRTPILQVPGVLSILGSEGKPTPLEPEEVGALQLLERAKVHMESWPFLKVGAWVVIEGGTLDGLVGILQVSRKAARVVVSVGLLNRAVAVEVDRAAVRATSPPKNRPDLLAPPSRKPSAIHGRPKIKTTG